jgi:hypothetical protein
MRWPNTPIRTRVAYARTACRAARHRRANPDGAADPLIVHPDIRRNLMDQKSLQRRRARADLLGRI